MWIGVIVDCANTSRWKINREPILFHWRKKRKKEVTSWIVSSTLNIYGKLAVYTFGQHCESESNVSFELNAFKQSSVSSSMVSVCMWWWVSRCWFSCTPVLCSWCMISTRLSLAVCGLCTHSPCFHVLSLDPNGIKWQNHTFSQNFLPQISNWHTQMKREKIVTTSSLSLSLPLSLSSLYSATHLICVIRIV